ncbi:MAG: PilZ domain-containing protein [Bdellovibrionota bacterium]
MGTKIAYIVDRRVTDRRDVRLPVELRKAGSQEDFLLEYAHNISHTGIFLATRMPLEPGTLLELVFRVPPEHAKEFNGAKTIRIEGRVIWANRIKEGNGCPNPGMGVRFEKIDENTLHLLEQIVHRVAVMPEE